eukprot:TRINITY_DN663_c0_g1_i3.p1 TRINITY_DN663_c0_g1~~TRINITY_DN663_c0_g1_i3.p1  ORF type:complete len:230 (+),score=61.92 TRINITY_DN663_c0_g1_i3:160-849(+)
MNPIQKLWLRALSPLAYVINEKLAKRSGLVGRIGKFFMIGPREFGVHPMTKAFLYANRRYLFGLGIALHKYSFFKSLTQNGFHVIRPMKHFAFMGPALALFALLRFVYFGPDNIVYEPDRLTYLSRRVGGRIALPTSTLNQRTSAHYIEINAIYSAEMVKRYHKIHRGIIEERNRQTDEVKKTRFADPSYKYEAMKPVQIPANPLSWTCLLYTSPSPRDRQKSRMPSSA